MAGRYRDLGAQRRQSEGMKSGAQGHILDLNPPWLVEAFISACSLLIYKTRTLTVPLLGCCETTWALWEGGNPYRPWKHMWVPIQLTDLILIKQLVKKSVKKALKKKVKCLLYQRQKDRLFSSLRTRWEGSLFASACSAVQLHCSEKMLLRRWIALSACVPFIKLSWQAACVCCILNIWCNNMKSCYPGLHRHWKAQDWHRSWSWNNSGNLQWF